MRKDVQHTIREIKDQIVDLEAHVLELSRQLEYGDIVRFKPNDKHDLKHEFEVQIDNRLYFIFMAYAGHMYRKYGYKPWITNIIRTHDEQINIYGNPDCVGQEKADAFMANPWDSPHEIIATGKGRALDFRDKDMTVEQIEDTKLFFSDNQVVYTGDHNTILRHSVGNLGSHFHLQVDKDKFTSIQRNY